MNNYPLGLAMQFCKEGHHVHFFYDNADDLHNPFKRYADFPENITFHPLKNHGYISLIYSSVTAKVIRGIIGVSDLIVVNDRTLFLPGFYRKKSLILFTGSDLEVLSDYKEMWALCGEPRPSLRYLAKMIRNTLYCWLCRRGIRAATLVNYFPKGIVPEGDKLLNKLKPRQISRQMLIDTNWVNKNVQDHNIIIKKQNLKIICTARHNWVHPMPVGYTKLDYKDTDKLVRALKILKYEKIVHSVILFEKGLHVNELKKLAAELEVDDLITWMPQVTQVQLLKLIQESHVVVDQLGESVVGMAGLETLTVNVPLIASSRKDIFDKITNMPSPIYHANTPQEVANQLIYLHKYGHRSKIGYEYVNQNLGVEKASNKFMSLLKLI